MDEEHTHDTGTCCECGGNHCCCECPVFDAPDTGCELVDPANLPDDGTCCLTCGHEPREHDDTAEAACMACDCKSLHMHCELIR